MDNWHGSFCKLIKEETKVGNKAIMKPYWNKEF